MHELSLVESLVQQVKQHQSGRAVIGITLQVGVLTCVDEQALQFCFDACKTQVGFENADLIVERQNAQGQCRQCGQTFTVTAAIQPCDCGSMDVDTQGGGDILLKQIDFAE